MALRLLAIVAAGLVIAEYRSTYSASANPVFVLYALVIVFLFWTCATAAITRRYPGPVPAGRLIALVPAYNEDPQLLLDCVASLERQTRPPDVIYVVDDGSDPPVSCWLSDRVVFIRQPNQGKRMAQAAGLRAAGGADFVLTVDSDSVCERHACERGLLAFSDPRVQAMTGMPILLNADRNLLTRMVDLEIVSACLVGRASRSYAGVVSPATGAFAIYRAGVVYDNLDDYVGSGIVGDDRRLAVYALRRGRVEALNDALVAVEMPSTLRASWRQRARWFRAFWRFLPWEIRVLPTRALFFRIWALVFGLITPVLLLWIFVVTPLVAHAVFWQGLVFWLAVSYTQTLPYVALRPHMALRSRVGAWLFLTPPLLLWQVLVIRPALIWALVRCRNDHWSTRPTRPARPALPRPELPATPTSDRRPAPTARGR